jgi:hypothetical protein
LLGESEATIVWDIPLDTKPGNYRIRHFGDSKCFINIITPYIGVSYYLLINFFPSKIPFHIIPDIKNISNNKEVIPFSYGLIFL